MKEMLQVFVKYRLKNSMHFTLICMLFFQLNNLSYVIKLTLDICVLS
jgi:hypothetical protein